MPDEEVVRLSAHVLLDALSAFDDASNADPDPAIRTALGRLAEIDAVALLYDDETDTRTIDIQPVIHASLRLLTSLVTLRLGDHPDMSGLDVIRDLRTVADAVGGAGYHP